MNNLPSTLSSHRIHASGCKRFAALLVWLAAGTAFPGAAPAVHATDIVRPLTVVDPETDIDSIRLILDPHHYWTTYKSLREHIAMIEAECRELRETIDGMRAEIQMHRANLKDFLTFLEHEHRAWKRIYATPGGTGASADGARDQPLPAERESRAEAKRTPELDSIVEWLNPARFMLHRIHKMRRDLERIVRTRDALRKELPEVEAELERIRRDAANARNRLEDQRKAWGRLYHE